MPEALTLDKAQPSSGRVAVPIKRNRSEDGRVGDPGPRSIPATRALVAIDKGNENATAGGSSKGIHGPRTDSLALPRIPSYLNKSRTEISLAFQDLEWRQRFRIQHALNDQHNSPYHFDRSQIVISRNRYGNLQPWDSHRVKLKRPWHGSDYINASPIVLRDGLQSDTGVSAGASKMLSNTEDSSRHSNGVFSQNTSDPTLDAIEESRYIATQGPKEGQYLPFWNMVMQETVGDVGVIVMLTPCYEGNREKCARYFPQNMANPVLVLEDDAYLDNAKDNGVGGDATPNGGLMTNDNANDQPRKLSLSAQSENLNITGEQTHPQEDDASSTPPSDSLSISPNSVTLLSLHYDANIGCEVRHLRLQLHSEHREVYHYLFPGWPDYSKPDRNTKDALLRLMHVTRDIAECKGQGGWPNPRIVHCSAGVGRTGTFIALDWLLHELEMGRLVENDERSRGRHKVAASNAQASNQNAVSSNQAIDTTTAGVIEPDTEEELKKPPAKQETWGASGPVKMPKPALVSTSIPLTSTTTDHRLTTPDPNTHDPFTQPAENSSDPTSTATSNPTINTSLSSSSTATDQIYETVNTLREQRMMMVMNEIQYSFIHEVVKDEFVKFYRRKAIGPVAIGKTTNVSGGPGARRTEDGQEEITGDETVVAKDIGNDKEKERAMEVDVGEEAEEETPSEAETDIVPEDYRIED